MNEVLKLLRGLHIVPVIGTVSSCFVLRRVSCRTLDFSIIDQKNGCDMTRCTVNFSMKL